MNKVTRYSKMMKRNRKSRARDMDTMSAVLKGLLGFFSCKRGAAAVEFAIISPVMLAALAGIGDYGVTVFEKMELVSAARSGAQMALDDYTDTAAIKQTVADATNAGISTGDVTTTTFCECDDGTSLSSCSDSCGTANVKYFMTITATKTHNLIFLGTPITLTGSTTVRVR